MSTESILEQRMRERRDRVFAYLTLASRRVLRQVDDQPKWVNNILAISGLPSLEELRKETEALMLKEEGSLIEGPVSNRTAELLRVGRENFSRIGMLGDSLVTDFWGPQELILPPIELVDGTAMQVSPRVTHSPSSWIVWKDEVEEWRERIESFLEACRVV